MRLQYLGRIINNRGNLEGGIGERLLKMGRLYNAKENIILKEIPQEVKVEIVKKVMKPKPTDLFALVNYK